MIWEPGGLSVDPELEEFFAQAPGNPDGGAVAPPDLGVSAAGEIVGFEPEIYGPVIPVKRAK